MIVVIQCAASKRADAGTFRDRSGQPLLFVANPAVAPTPGEYRYVRPDDVAEDGVSWRDQLTAYNESQGNPFNLLRAFELYENRAYQELVGRLGMRNVFILSAGWGLIAADFLTPLYDITFSTAVKKDAPWKFRRPTDVFQDYNQLPQATTDHVVYVGGKDYVPLFASLTTGIQGKRTVFYNSDSPPNAVGCAFERFDTRTRTNWHYECARWLLSR